MTLEFSTVARRYSIFLYLPFLWILWGSTLSDVEPWSFLRSPPHSAHPHNLSSSSSTGAASILATWLQPFKPRRPKGH